MKGKNFQKMKLGPGYLYLEPIKTAKIKGLGKNGDTELLILLYSGGITSQYGKESEAKAIIEWLEKNREPEEFNCDFFD
jgi:hypothetical protein